ncbi:Protein NATD1 [Gracilariopsis chorda]|uniref:Protein NATD1 n=1 Tax=Gracilariopsis chorda TaxID=448386 RepID=A0A2V3J6M8_9FLOR|nr:Protein NATD1 [Gracilariopsis chorda]|eukprot:PXF50065.1 Protein NATD1 [Gracilariopsis chorda]
MTEEVIHQPDESRFIIRLHEDQEPAFLAYIVSDTDKVYDLNHTYTPPALRGKGVAAKLVKHATSFAREKGYKIIPTCSYVAVYMERHPEDKDVLRVE